MEALNKILVTGSNGQLGKSLKKYLATINIILCFFDRDELDITDSILFNNILLKYEINIVINCAAYTNVNKTTNHFHEANEINNISLGYISKICSKYNIKLIHISTDYIFDGSKTTPYNEDDESNPINMYGETKLNGELRILNSELNNSAIIRTSWLYSSFGNNFVNSVIRKIKSNQDIYITSFEIGSPTNASDLASLIFNILPHINHQGVKVYHYANSGYCSRFELAKYILSNFNSDSMIHESYEKESEVKRPYFSALDTKYISKTFNVKIYDWKKRIKDYIFEIKKSDGI